MADRQLTVTLITNSVYGESNYEQMVWEGASRACAELGVRLCSVAGGQIRKLPNGKIKMPFLFKLAALSASDGYLLNCGTTYSGISSTELPTVFQDFLRGSAVATANEVEGALYAGVDNVAGMKAILNHLVENLGKKRIAYVSGPYNNAEAVDRLRAYKEVLAEHQIPYDEQLVSEGNWLSPSGADAVARLIDQNIPFDAFAAANDLMAADVLDELQRRGYTIPNDLPVSGFDDIELASFCTPKLSTVLQPISEMAEVGVRQLVDHISGRRPHPRQLVPARLVLRGSAPAGETESGGAAIEDRAADPQKELAQLADFIVGVGRGHEDAAFMRPICDAMAGALSGKSASVANIINRSIQSASAVQVTFLDAFAGQLRAFRDAKLRSIVSWKKSSSILFELNKAINEFRLTETYKQSKTTEKLTNNLININRILNEVGSLDALESAIERSFPLAGIKTCHVVLFADERTIEGEAVRVASIVDGKGQLATRSANRFEARLLLDGGLNHATGRDWIVCPLAFEDQNLGYMVFHRAPVSPFIYEALANQIAALLHSILLIQKIEKAEELAAQRAEKISELVRPMLDTINASSELARSQSSTMAKLASANTETSARLAESERHVSEMQDDLKKIISLTTTIDELSETINVIAINAAIAAARAGSDGKVFGVISAEIRKLSIQTKTSTEEISNYLAELGKNSSSFIESNSQTRQVFSSLETEIQSLLGSLENIQNAMADLTSRAQLVLSTMS